MFLSWWREPSDGRFQPVCLNKTSQKDERGGATFRRGAEAVFTGQVCRLASKSPFLWTRVVKSELLALPLQAACFTVFGKSLNILSHLHHPSCRSLTERFGGSRRLCVCVYLSKCVFVFMSGRSSSHSSSGGHAQLRSPKQISSSVSCRLKSNCQNKDAERAFKRKRSIPSCVSVELFWGSLAGRVKVYFVFAAGPQHKASGSWLVKC